MKKIVFFIGELKKGGAERVVSILSKSLRDKEFNVEIVTYFNHGIDYEIDSRVKVTAVAEANNSNNIISNLIWLRKYFKNNADIIISFLAPFNILSLVANIGINKPIIVADRNDPKRIPTNKYVRKIRDLIYKKANYVVVQTENNKEYFNYLKNDKVIVIGNPIDLKEYKGKALKTNKKDLIISVGRLKPQKNQMMLIDAFNNIHEKYSTYKLVIYGEGESRSELESRIKELDLEEYILLPGETKEVFEKLIEAKLFVLSSNYEGMPNALMEAMCLGLPCISTKVSGSNELIENDVNGLLVDINDTKQLTEVLDQLLANEKIRNNFAKEAIKLNDLLDIETITNKWIKLINELVK